MKDSKGPDSDLKERRFLAIDYGIKRIGLALTDPMLSIAFPYKTIQNDSYCLDKIADIIKEKSVTKIVLGYPSSEEIRESGFHKEVLKFAEELKEFFNLEIILWDETYTSSIAKARILESVTSRKKRRDKSLLDQQSAAIILQEYIDSLH
ncbi:MAG: Holliday junction resolvase RuvX [Ignavibacteriaceae bacterium]